MQITIEITDAQFQAVPDYNAMTPDNQITYGQLLGDRLDELIRDDITPRKEAAIKAKLDALETADPKAFQDAVVAKDAYVSVIEAAYEKVQSEKLAAEPEAAVVDGSIIGRLRAGASAVMNGIRNTLGFGGQ